MFSNEKEKKNNISRCVFQSISYKALLIRKKEAIDRNRKFLIKQSKRAPTSHCFLNVE